jgi:hypothetical protein
VATIREAKVELQEHKLLTNDLALKQFVSQLPCDAHRTILRGKETGQWLTVLRLTVNGTKLLAHEF